VSSPPTSPIGAVRVVICDYNALLASVTGLLRMSGYYVFQAYDGEAATELCTVLPDVSLLVLNTEGTGVDTPAMVRRIRERKPHLAVLHIGTHPLPGMPEDVISLDEKFTAARLLDTVAELLRTEWKK
jgi:response regulator RpfG family c-di-GMP phosphodiesterase